MNEKAEQIRAALIKILGLDKPRRITGTVDSVDETAWTCSVTCANGLKIADAQLKALKEAEKGVVIVPKKGTTVWLQSIGDPDWLVISVDEVDKIYMDADTSVIFNGGKNGGLVVIGKLVEKLNNLEDAISDLAQQYNSHTHITTATIGSTATPGVNATTTSQATKVLINTQEADIKNDKVKH